MAKYLFSIFEKKVVKPCYYLLFLTFLFSEAQAQIEIILDFPIDTDLWEIGGDASVADLDGINGDDEILLTPFADSQMGYIKYKEYINFVQCENWVLDFDFRLWSEEANSSGEGFAFTLLNNYIQREGGELLGIPQDRGSLGLVIAFDTFDNCSKIIHDNPEIQISEINVEKAPFYRENCRPQSSPRNAKLGIGKYEEDIKILRSKNYRPARIIYEGKNLSVFIDVDNDGVLDEVLRPTRLNLDYNYGMQMGFSASTGSFADNQSIKNVSMKIESNDILSERELIKCPNEDLEISGGIQFLSYTWKDENGNILSQKQNYSVSEVGTYILEKEFSCGKEIETIKVSENDLSIGEITTTVSCGYTEIEIDVIGGSPSYLYSIIDGKTSQSFNKIKIYTPGEYIVQVRDANNCFAQKKIVVDEVTSPMFINLFQSSPNKITAVNTGGLPPFLYQFEKREQSTLNVFRIPGPGIFTIIVEDSLGCTKQAKIEIECDPFEIPNYFSPNGDGTNDYWTLPKMDCYPDFEATVYDRQGRLIYQFSDDIGWDGTYNGNYLPSTDYWYSIKLNEYTNPITGHFNLYR